MTVALWLAVALTSQAKTSPDLKPMDLFRGMEIEALDREAQRRHDTVLYARGRLTTARRLAGKAKPPGPEVERLAEALQFEEAREVELIAVRALKVYERDVASAAVPPDASKAYRLLLDWVQAQEAVAQVDVNRRTDALERAKALGKRRGATPQEVEDTELAYRASYAGLADLRAREARVLLDMADGPAGAEKLKREARQARLRSAEAQAENAARRLEIARDRVRLSLMPASELSIFEKAVRESGERLEREKKAGPDDP